VIRARLGLAILLALAACQLFGVDPAATANRPAPPLQSIPGLGIALLALAGGSTVVYFQRARTRELRARRRTAVAEAQLEALQFQLRPHFLFNTLHTLLPLVDKDPVRARSMVVRLGDLLRLSLRAEERPLVTLGEEVEILESYLVIEQVRFRDRLDVSIGVEPEAAAAAVPSFLLQPLIENALENGGTGAGRRIAVTARIDGGELAIAVGNEGPLFAFPPPSSDARGLGLRHTRRRLEALYPGRHRLDLVAAPGGGTQVRLRIPLSFVPPAALAG
jgi:LytS/YehU family sensor histidine kinase